VVGVVLYGRSRERVPHTCVNDDVMGRKPTGFFLFSWLLLLSIKTRRSVAAADALISGGGRGSRRDEKNHTMRFVCL
jgi:hypothetical protein